MNKLFDAAFRNGGIFTYERDQYPNGSPRFFIVKQPGTYEGIPEEPKVVADVTTESIARLFAAAPELLEFLTALRNRMANSRDGSPHRVLSEEDFAILQVLVLKAEGI